MKGTEKRMKFYNLSKNIVACDNFLNLQNVDEIFTDFLNNRNRFNVPNWGYTNEEKEKSVDEHQIITSKCGGLDFWIEWEDAKKENSFIGHLKNWFFSQGLYFHIGKDNYSAFQFLLDNTNRLFWNIHVVSCNNKGFYNWHKDLAPKNLFTFNLVLQKTKKLKGGDMLFMDENKIIEVENKNNFMVVFPSFVPHAITPLYSENNEDVSFLEQRFSIQFWVGLL